MALSLPERDGRQRTYSPNNRVVTDYGYRTYLDNFLNKPGPTTDPHWVPGEVTITGLETSKVLSVYLGTCANIQYAEFLQCDVGTAYPFFWSNRS